MERLGGWAFLIGVVLAIVFGALGSVTGSIITILVILGIVVGLINITEKEVSPFLMAGAVLVIVAALGKDVLSEVTIVGNILYAIIALFVPATIVVALKSVLGMAKRK